jgi:hypothetical protein
MTTTVEVTRDTQGRRGELVHNPQRHDVIRIPRSDIALAALWNQGVDLAGSDPSTGLLWRDPVSRAHDVLARATAAQPHASIEGLGPRRRSCGTDVSARGDGTWG